MIYPSWQECVDTAIDTIMNDLFEYIDSDEFESEWENWTHETLLCDSEFREKLDDILDKEWTKQLFPYIDQTTDELLMVIEYSVCTQFQFIHSTMNDNVTFERIKELCKNAVSIAISMGYEDNYSPYGYLCNKYKRYWHSAEKIQIQWRKSISDPKYALCRKRLLKEFEEMKEIQ